MAKSKGVAVYAVDPEQRHVLLGQSVTTRAEAQKIVRMAGYLERDIPPDLGPSPWSRSGEMAFHVYVMAMRPMTLEEKLGLLPSVARGSAPAARGAKAKGVQYKLLPGAFDDQRQTTLDQRADVRAATSAERAKRSTENGTKLLAEYLPLFKADGGQDWHRGGDIGAVFDGLGKTWEQLADSGFADIQKLVRAYFMRTTTLYDLELDGTFTTEQLFALGQSGKEALREAWVEGLTYGATTDLVHSAQRRRSGDDD